jgi:hypothetical protein
MANTLLVFYDSISFLLIAAFQVIVPPIVLRAILLYGKQILFIYTGLQGWLILLNFLQRSPANPLSGRSMMPIDLRVDVMYLGRVRGMPVVVARAPACAQRIHRISLIALFCGK